MTLAQWIRAKGLTQTQAAALFSATRPTLSGWLRRGTIPRPRHMRLIYRKTGGAVSADDFYGFRRRLSRDQASRGLLKTRRCSRWRAIGRFSVSDLWEFRKGCRSAARHERAATAATSGGLPL